MLLFLGALFGVGGQMGMAAMQAREAAKNREFQERMFKHRYQYQVDDLRKAGLNVAMAYGQQPPGPPGGAQAQLPKLDIGGQLSGAADAAAKKKSLQVMEEQAKAYTAQATREHSQALLNAAQTQTTAATARWQDAQAKVANANARILEPKAVGADKAAEAIGEGSTWWDKVRHGRGHGETLLDLINDPSQLWTGGVRSSRNPQLEVNKRGN